MDFKKKIVASILVSLLVIAFAFIFMSFSTIRNQRQQNLDNFTPSTDIPDIEEILLPTVPIEPEVVTDPIVVHVHNWIRATCLTPRRCLICDEEQGEPRGHDIIEATYREQEHCSRCGEVFGERLSNFLERNAERYDEFQLLFPDKPFDIIVALVNADVDLDGYEYPQMVEDPYDYLVLITQRFRLSDTFSPSDLISIPGTGSLRYSAANAYIAMRKEAMSEGLTLISMSAYRSYVTQKRIFNNSVNSRGLERTLESIARQGHSEHQTGLAVDILHRTGTSTLSGANFQDTREFAWLKNNAHRWGFILRYPQNTQYITKIIFEAWHWRFVGIEVATYMFENNILTFEEFHGRYLITE